MSNKYKKLKNAQHKNYDSLSELNFFNVETQVKGSTPTDLIYVHVIGTLPLFKSGQGYWDDDNVVPS